MELLTVITEALVLEQRTHSFVLVNWDSLGKHAKKVSFTLFVHSGISNFSAVCDSARDCNGRGLCFGTTNQLTCRCNLGFTGKRCQTAI